MDLLIEGLQHNYSLKEIIHGIESNTETNHKIEQIINRLLDNEKNTIVVDLDESKDVFTRKNQLKSIKFKGFPFFNK